VVVNSIVCGFTITAITTTLNVINLGLEKMGGAKGITITAIVTLSCGVLAAFICFEFLYIINVSGKPPAYSRK